MFTLVAPDVWTLSIPHRFLGLHFGARMTVVRLPDGGLWIHSPVPLDPERRAAVTALGPVRALVAPNLFHHLYVGDWSTAFPEAKVHLAPGLAKKRPELSGEPLAPDAWPDTFTGVPVDGWGMNETTFFHRATGTLISCDLFANLAPSTDTWTRFYRWAMALETRPSVSRAIRPAVTDKAAVRRSIDSLIDLAPTRILVSHGEGLDSDAPEGLREAWSWLRA